MILKPGENFWRISKATKARLLIDGDAYFSQFGQAVIKAQQRFRPADSCNSAAENRWMVRTDDNGCLT